MSHKIRLHRCRSSAIKKILLIFVIGTVISYFITSLKLFLDPGRHLLSLPSFRHTTRDTRNCTFPITTTFPKYFQNWNPKNDYQDCGHETNLFKISDDGNLTLLPLDDASDTCCIRDIIRGRKDSEYTISECRTLTSPENVEDRESFIVQCGNSTNFGAWCPDKPAVDRKIQYWTENFPDVGDRPYSVLFFGFDTVSRAHAFRSLPKSLKLMMEELNFVDFKAYHSIAGSTLTNFMGFLMGLPRQVVRGTCAKTWKTPFDSCPLIWKKYNDSHYVTSYLEDGNQSFDWGGQSGFTDVPTDYYIHHFFKAMQKIRSKEKKKSKLGETREDCVSKEPIPDFLLRYTKRVLRKFEGVPLFHFLWFANPFHEDLKYLSNFDDVLLEFLEFLQRSPRILRKTLIIMVSDHGDRFQFYSEESSESFIERGAPPLFIRLPDELVEKHPEMANALRTNADFLTTPFDIHHTLLHWLRLNEIFPNGNKDTSNLAAEFIYNDTKSAEGETFIDKNRQVGDNVKFVPVLPDRSSLLVPVPTNRNCAMTNIPDVNCLCNVPYSVNGSITSVGSEFADVAIEGSLAELNARLDRYYHGHLCKPWSSNYKGKKNFGRIIGSGEDYKEVLVSFKTHQGGATFESRVKVFVKRNYFGLESPAGTEILGMGRTNAYGDQSKCVPMMTDADKEMKEFCFCR